MKQKIKILDIGGELKQDAQAILKAISNSNDKGLNLMPSEIQGFLKMQNKIYPGADKSELIEDIIPDTYLFLTNSKYIMKLQWGEYYELEEREDIESQVKHSKDEE